MLRFVIICNYSEGPHIPAAIWPCTYLSVVSLSNPLLSQSFFIPLVSQFTFPQNSRLCYSLKLLVHYCDGLCSQTVCRVDVAPSGLTRSMAPRRQRFIALPQSWFSGNALVDSDTKDYPGIITVVVVVVPCSPGQYKEGVEGETCDDCPNGKFQPNFGSRSCRSCPRFGTTIPGATSVEDCSGNI